MGDPGGMPTIVYRGNQYRGQERFWNYHPEFTFAMVQYLRWFLDAPAPMPEWMAAGTPKPAQLSDLYREFSQTFHATFPVPRDNFGNFKAHLDADWFPPAGTSSDFFRVLELTYDQDGDGSPDIGDIAKIATTSTRFGRKFERVVARGYLEAFEAMLFLQSNTNTQIGPQGAAVRLELQVQGDDLRTARFVTPPRVRPISIYWVCGKDDGGDVQVFIDQELVTVFLVTPPLNGSAGNPSEGTQEGKDRLKSGVVGEGMILVRDNTPRWSVNLGPFQITLEGPIQEAWFNVPLSEGA